MSINAVDKYLNNQYELQQSIAFEEFKKDVGLDDMEIDFNIYQLIRKSFFVSYNQGHFDSEVGIKNAYKLYPHKFRKWVEGEN